jgi:hypothetical protein
VVKWHAVSLTPGMLSQSARILESLSLSRQNLPFAQRSNTTPAGRPVLYTTSCVANRAFCLEVKTSCPSLRSVRYSAVEDMEEEEIAM